MSAQPIRRKHKRPRPQTSCSVCHRRKVRCDKQQPCGPCIRHGSEDDCTFDGLSAFQSRDALRHLQSGDTRSNHHARNNNHLDRPSNLAASHTTAESNAPGHRQWHTLDEAQVLPALGTPSSHRTTPSKLRTHDWLPGRGLTRGRSHMSWSSKPFEQLLAYAGITLNDCPNTLDTKTALHVLEQLKLYEPIGSQPTSIFNDLPLIGIGFELIARFFESFNTVYELYDSDSFMRDFSAMIGDHSQASSSLAVAGLLMKALANATYSRNEAPLSSKVVNRWLAVANAYTAYVIDTGLLDTDMLRLFALLVLAEQVLKLDSTSAYVRSGSCVRSAMALGLHRSRDEMSVRLWCCICDLDLHASLAAGTSPALPLTHLPNDDALPVQTSAVHDIHRVMSASLNTRYLIVQALNDKTILDFESVVELSGQLTRTMAPISTDGGFDAASSSFATKFLSFSYARFLAALHRPFATFNDGFFYLSRSMTLRPSKQYVKELTAVFRDSSTLDSFAALLTTPSTMFRTEARQAIMAQCYELYRSDISANGTQSVLSLPEDGHLSRLSIMKDFFAAAEQKLLKGELDKDKFLMIPAMVFAHLDAIQQFNQDSSEYVRYMTEVGNLARHCSPAQ